ncbi:MAG: exodeoxyribonuclease VII small subunit [Porticoccus sp.]
MAARKKSVDFEHKLSQLEILVSEMEKGSLSLEDSLKAFEDGIKITRECQQALKDAEQKVEMLTRDSDQPTPFEPENE